MGPIVQAAVESLRPAAEAKGVRLTIRLGDGHERVSGDPDRLQQVVWNLVSNAIKFTEPGGDVDVDVVRSEEHVETRVRDTGKGIEPELLPHVFERFWQADVTTTRRHDGLGLGLAIVRHLVELHGGTVEVESGGPGKGASFSVRLPLTTAPAAQERAPRASAPRRLEGVRVLVVDDEADAQEIARMALEQSGVEVRTAGSARAGTRDPGGLGADRPGVRHRDARRGRLRTDPSRARARGDARRPHPGARVHRAGACGGSRPRARGGVRRLRVEARRPGAARRRGRERGERERSRFGDDHPGEARAGRIPVVVRAGERSCGVSFSRTASVDTRDRFGGIPEKEATMETGSLPVIRIADDGELADVRQLIEELGVEWVADDEAPNRPTALWIGTPGRLMAAGTAGAPAAFRIVVADKMTKTLQRQLERAASRLPGEPPLPPGGAPAPDPARALRGSGATRLGAPRHQRHDPLPHQRLLPRRHPGRALAGRLPPDRAERARARREP